MQLQSGGDKGFYQNTYKNTPAGSDYPKVEINVAEHAYGSEWGISVHPMDLIIDEAHSVHVYAHEFSHTLDYRNSGTIVKSFSESFAILNAWKAINVYGAKRFTFNPDNYYHFPNEKEALADFESYYRDIKVWDAYLSGYRFGLLKMFSGILLSGMKKTGIIILNVSKCQILKVPWKAFRKIL